MDKPSSAGTQAGAEAPWIIALRQAFRDKNQDGPGFRHATEACLKASYQANDALGKAVAMVCMAVIAAMDGDFDSALPLAEKGNGLLWQLRPQDPMVGIACNLLGIINMDQGNTEKAFLQYHRAQQNAQANGDLHLLGSVMGNLAKVYRDLGNTDQARTLMTEARQLAVGLGDSYHDALHAANLAVMEISLGRHAQATALLDQAEELARRHRYLPIIANVLNERGRLEEGGGAVAAARARYAEAERLFTEIGYHEPAIHCMADQVRLLLKLGESEAAAGLAAKARGLAADQGFCQLESSMGLLLADAWEQLGDSASALKALRQALGGLGAASPRELILKHDAEELKRQLASFESIRRTGARLSMYHEGHQLMELLAEACFGHTPAVLVGLLVDTGDGLRLRLRRRSGEELDFNLPESRRAASIACFGLRHAEELLVGDLARDHGRYLDEAPVFESELAGSDRASLLGVPVSAPELPPAYLFLLAEPGKPLLPLSLPPLRLLAYFTAIGLRNEQTVRGLKQEVETVQSMAYRDPLTALLNRRGFEDKAALLRDFAVRNKLPMYCLMVDGDNFKRVNDTWGHPAGDAALVCIGEALRAVFKRDTDLLCRYGGEEFLVLASVAPRAVVEKLAEQLRARVQAASFPAGEVRAGITVSIGVAGSDEPTIGLRLEDLVQAADEALYAAKKGGKNRVVLAPPVETEAKD